jgi:hypothetical protein
MFMNSVPRVAPAGSRGRAPLLQLLVMLVMSGCTAVQVSQDYDPATDFSSYQTFGWAPEPERTSGDPVLDSPLMDRRIRSAVEETLRAKGYSFRADERPDVQVAYYLYVRSRIEADTFRSGYGWYGYRYPYWGGWGYDTVLRQYDEGTLIIDFVEVGSGKLIWRGTGSRRVTLQTDPAKTTKMVYQTVAEILKQFPPTRGNG